MIEVVTIEDLPLEFLRCRAFAHKWEEFLPFGKRRGEWGFRVSLLCTSCGTERHDTYDSLAALGARQYVYPEGYQLDVKASKEEIRLLYERRRKIKTIARRGHLEVAV